MMELFLPLSGIKDAYILSERYRVSSHGRIYDILKHKFCSLSLCGIPQYYYITLHHNGSKGTFRVNRLVGLSFIPNPDGLPIVDHIDRNKLNNKVDNLRWLSYSDNMLNRDWIDEMPIRHEKKRVEKEKLQEEKRIIKERKEYVHTHIIERIKYLYAHEYTSVNRLGIRFNLTPYQVENIVKGVTKKPLKPKFSPMDCNRIYIRGLVRQKYLEGFGYKFIAELYNITPKMVEGDVRDLPNQRKKGLSMKIKANIYKRYLIGERPRDLALEFAVDKSAISNIRRSGMKGRFENVDFE